MRIAHRLTSDSRPVIHSHPHAHQIGMAAVLVGLIALPLAYTVVLPMLAIVLGVLALLLSRHPAPGMNASPEAWVAIAMGITGVAFGAAQLLLMRIN